MPARRHAAGAALAVATALLLAACTDASTDDATGSPSPTAAAPTATADASPSANPSPTANISASGVELWPDHGDFLIEGNKAIKNVTKFRVAGRDADADMLMRIAGTAQARWIGDWHTNEDNIDLARNVYDAAAEQGRIALISVSGDPGAECGITDADAARAEYRETVNAIAAPAADFDVEVWAILEPGALPSLGDCEGQGDRMAMLGDGLTILSDAGFKVYIDAGSDRFGPDAAETVARLQQLDLDKAAGLALGLGTMDPTAVEAARGDEILEALSAAGHDDLGYIIDTARNGVADATGASTAGDETCNAPGQAIGKAPRVVNDGNLDAYVWMKRPGESDGMCNSNVIEGQFHLPLAMELARNADPANA